MSLVREISKRGIVCHQCRKWVYPGKTYYRHYYDRDYFNFCVKCALKESAIRIQEYRKINNETMELCKKYSKQDETICNTCKHRYKHVVGDCNPYQSGCKPQKVKNGNNKKK